MTRIRMVLFEPLRKYGLGKEVDFLQEAVHLFSQMIMNLGASEQIRASKYERSRARESMAAKE